jgi:hypothetical protein
MHDTNRKNNKNVDIKVSEQDASGQKSKYCKGE